MYVRDHKSATTASHCRTKFIIIFPGLATEAISLDYMSIGGGITGSTEPHYGHTARAISTGREPLPFLAGISPRS
jgi:hypothetical protein